MKLEAYVGTERKESFAGRDNRMTKLRLLDCSNAKNIKIKITVVGKDTEIRVLHGEGYTQSNMESKFRL